MENDQQEHIRMFFTKEITNLNFRRFSINKAVKRFEITQDQANLIYRETKRTIRKSIVGRGFLFLFLGIIPLSLGLYGTFDNNGVIFYGAILIGSGLVLSSLGYFLIALNKN